MEENVVQCWMNTLLLNLGTDSIINSITQNFVILTSYLSPLNLNTIIYRPSSHLSNTMSHLLGAWPFVS